MTAARIRRHGRDGGIEAGRGGAQAIRGRVGIEVKTPAQIKVMREAGLVVARTLRAVSGAVGPGVTTAELDALAEREIRGAGAIPSFKGYHGYPATICTSVNDEIVHGIPSRQRSLREGDIVSIDCGVVLDGYYGDAAVTVPVGEISPEVRTLVTVTKESLDKGIAAAQVGGRVGDIGLERLRPPARLFDCRDCGLGSLGVCGVIDGDRIAIGGETAADCCANAPRTSGDDDQA